MIYKRIDKLLTACVQMGLKDKYHPQHEPEISDEAKAWVIGLACTQPKDHGLVPGCGQSACWPNIHAVLLGGWKTLSMVDCYAKFATEHLAVAASRIESVTKENVIELSRFCHDATK